MKKLLALILTIGLLFASLSIASAATNNIKVVVDGKEIKLDVPPVLENNRTLVPIRAIAEALGATVQYDAGTKTASVTTCDAEVLVTLDSKKAQVNGVEKTLDVAAKAVSGRTLLPLRFVSEALGAEVNYTPATSTVTVNYFSNMTGTVKIGGSTTIQPINEAAKNNLQAVNKTLEISVAGGGSGAGIKGVMDGTFNIGAASRELSDAELTTFPDIKDFAIGSDGIAVITNLENPVTNLTKQQVFDIFTGKTTNWKDVGGDNAPILVQTREPASGTLTAFMELAIQKIDKAGVLVTTATPHSSNGLIKEAVASGKNTIGFLSLGFLDKTINAPKVESVSATVVNALTKKWPYVRPLNIVTNGTPSGNTAKFINYLLSPAGQEILVKENYLPLKVED